MTGITVLATPSMVFPAMATRDEIDALTGLRGIAAVSVLLYHIPHAPAFQAFAIPLFSRAYLAVDLFFILSE
jgi:peptidoglycan/LPS O-acetylase OafA/YrhL